MTLGEALAPVGIEEFLRHYAGQRFVVIRGTCGRFQDLVSWQQLNEVLSRLRVNDNRVSLVRQAQGIPRDSYVCTSQSGRVQYLRGPSVTKHVSAGATLVVNQVDELFPAIRRLAESCEEVFQIYVSANLYAGWRTDNGFDVHWDSHDTLITQVIGRKDWKIWKPTRLHPLAGEDPGIVPSPSEDPVWQGTLEDGDTLYMPRGWWHVAYPRDEPSLHVTIGLNHATGMDMLAWVLDQLKESVYARMDLPHWNSVDEQKVWIRAVRDACGTALSDDVIERYMLGLAERAHPRPIVRLPETVPATALPTLGNLTPLRLSHGRRLNLHGPNGASMMSFKVRGVEWQCHEALAPGVALLNHIKPCTLRDMSLAVENRARTLLRPFITALVLADVVWAEPTATASNDNGQFAVRTR